MLFEVIKARAAFERGLTRYFTGKPCKRGHVAQRMVSSGMCCECLNENRSKWRRHNPEKHRAQSRAYKATMRATNPAAEKARQEAWRSRREAKLASIAGRPRSMVCDLCHEPGPTKFDHCHARGHFRGWLCDRCNRTLGQVKDDPNLLRAMADYLEKNDGSADNEATQRAA